MVLCEQIGGRAIEGEKIFPMPIFVKSFSLERGAGEGVNE